MSKKWFVYIVECNDDKKSLYTGISVDVNKRIDTHNSGKGSKILRSKLPVKLLVSFEFENRSLASKEEYRIKQLSRESKLKLIDVKKYKQT